MNKDIMKSILEKYSYHYVGGWKEGYHNTENEVFHFEFNEDEIWIRESCDSWFYMELDSKKCEEISNLFKELSVMLKD